MGRHGESIFKRNDGRWEARCIKEISTAGKKKYMSFYGKSYKEVKEKRRLYLQSGIANKTNTEYLSVEYIMLEWLSNKKLSVKESTYHKYRNIVCTHIVPFFRETPIYLFSESSANNFINYMLENNLSKSSINDIVLVLNMGLKYAYLKYGVKLSHVTMLKADKKAIRVLTASEQKLLVKYALNHMSFCSLGILLSLYCGMRIGEICALQWSDINDGVIKINKTMQRLINESGGTRVIITEPKSSSSNRIIPVSSFMADILSLYKNNQGYVLIQENGKYVEPRLLQLNFSKFAKACNIENVTFHCLRHTFATKCIESGCDPKTLSEILGHSDVKITLNRYVHSSFALKKENMEKLNYIEK